VVDKEKRAAQIEAAKAAQQAAYNRQPNPGLGDIDR
jgi:hypothetical protein